jgi:hypothetical protein
MKMWAPVLTAAELDQVSESAPTVVTPDRAQYAL